MSPTEEDVDALSRFSSVMSNVFLFFLIFGLSATVRIQDLKHQLTNKSAIITGVAMQFLIMPFLGFASVMMFKGQGFTEAMGISLLVVTASPGGSYSNWWCNLFNAELALSVAMTSVSSILSLGLLPANLFFYSWLAYNVILEPDENDEDRDVIGSLDFNAIFISLGVVLGAIISGLYTGYKVSNPHFHENVNHFGSFCGIALILFSVFLGGGGGGDSDTNFWSLPWSFYVGTALPCIVGMALANLVSRCFRLSPPEVVAISIECCYQNTAIATSVAITMFDDPDERAEAVSVPLFYGAVEAAIICAYCVWAWKMGWTKAPADEKICVVMTKTYEAGALDDDDDEWEGELPKSWFKRLFVPKVVETLHRADPPTHGSGECEKKEEEAPRGRFESADVTVSTAMASPPGTPDVGAMVDESAEVQLGLITEGDMNTQKAGSLLYDAQYRIEEAAEEMSSPDSKGVLSLDGNYTALESYPNDEMDAATADLPKTANNDPTKFRLVA